MSPNAVHEGAEPDQEPFLSIVRDSPIGVLRESARQRDVGVNVERCPPEAWRGRRRRAAHPLRGRLCRYSSCRGPRRRGHRPGTLLLDVWRSALPEARPKHPATPQRGTRTVVGAACPSEGPVPKKGRCRGRTRVGFHFDEGALVPDDSRWCPTGAPSEDPQPRRLRKSL
jgi:hypothetical protein